MDDPETMERNHARAMGRWHPYRAWVLAVAVVLAFWIACGALGWCSGGRAAAEPAPGVVPPEEGEALDPASSLPFQVCARIGLAVLPWGVTERGGGLVIQCIQRAALESKRFAPPEEWRAPSPEAMDAFCLRATGKPLAPVAPSPANAQRRFWWLGFGLFWCGEPSDVRFDRKPRAPGLET